MTVEALTETVSEPRGPIADGEHRFFYRERQWTDRGDPWTPQYEVLADLPANRRIVVQRQGGLCDGGWGVDVTLDSEGYAVAPDEARRWAHAVLAAADLAERVEQHVPDEAPSATPALDQLLDQALNYLCDADNLASMRKVPSEVGDLLRHSIAEAVKRIEQISTETCSDGNQDSTGRAQCTGAGASLRRLRCQAGLTLEQTAELAGTSVRYLRRVEEGRSWCSRLFVGRVAQVLVERL